MKKVIKVTYSKYDSNNIKVGYLDTTKNIIKLYSDINLATVYNYTNDAVVDFIANSEKFREFIFDNSYEINNIEICEVNVTPMSDSISITNIIEY